MIKSIICAKVIKLIVIYKLLFKKLKGEQVFNLFPLMRLLNNVLDTIEYEPFDCQDIDWSNT